MRAVIIRGVSDEFEVDVCLPCQFIWLDTNETMQLPVLPHSTETADTLSPEAKQALALLKVQSMADNARREREADDFLKPFRMKHSLLAHLLEVIVKIFLRR